MKRLVGTLGMLAFFAVGAVGAIRVWNLAGSTYDAMTFPSHIAPGVTPRLKASDAYRITLDYLNAQTPELAAPEIHSAPQLTSIWAVTASQANALDGCIPTDKGSGVVWVTKGRGDYLNLAVRPWSSPGLDACSAPGPSGTLVIDDATGKILGVFPYSGPDEPHPTPQVTISPPSATPVVPGASASSSPVGSAAASPSGH